MVGNQYPGQLQTAIDKGKLAVRKYYACAQICAHGWAWSCSRTSLPVPGLRTVVSGVRHEIETEHSRTRRVCALSRCGYIGGQRRFSRSVCARNKVAMARRIIHLLASTVPLAVLLVIFSSCGVRVGAQGRHGGLMANDACHNINSL